MSTEGLDDKMKMKILMEIIELINNPAIIQAPVIPEKAQAEIKIRQNDDIMAVITDFITKKGNFSGQIQSLKLHFIVFYIDLGSPNNSCLSGTSQQLTFKPLTSAEYVKAVRDLFEVSEPLTQHVRFNSTCSSNPLSGGPPLARFLSGRITAN